MKVDYEKLNSKVYLFIFLRILILKIIFLMLLNIRLLDSAEKTTQTTTQMQSKVLRRLNLILGQFYCHF